MSAEILEKNSTMNKDGVKTLIEEFLNELTVEFDSIEIHEDDTHLIFLIRTSNSGVLIGNNGENLRALNYIIRKINDKRLGGGEDSHHFILDVNGYHQKKIQKIKDQASILADRARMFKSSVELSPMNSYERMIIHTMFADDPVIETESSGEGKMRRVVLHCKKEEKQSNNIS